MTHQCCCCMQQAWQDGDHLVIALLLHATCMAGRRASCDGIAASCNKHGRTEIILCWHCCCMQHAWQDGDHLEMALLLHATCMVGRRSSCDDTFATCNMHCRTAIILWWHYCYMQHAWLDGDHLVLPLFINGVIAWRLYRAHQPIM